MRALAWLVFVAIISSAQAVRGDEVWWEGENPAKTNFPAKTWMSGENLANKALLSGGQWLTADGKRGNEELFATYTVTAPADGTYALWSRKFWQHGPFTWKFDNDPPTTCGRDVALADSVELQTHLVANWVYLGKVKLAKGQHTFEIRLLAKAGENTTAAFDCFLLTIGAFMPNGKLKPGERSGLAEEGYFAWEPALDTFKKEALLDLRWLSEKTAGEKGYVKRVGDGAAGASGFELASGEGVRFFGVNVSPGNAGGARESVDYLADALAKRGVNMVRIHGGIYDFAKSPEAIDAKKLDDLQYFVAAMKKRGIYTTLSFYFPLWVDAEKDLKFADYATVKNKHPFALLMFDADFQKIYRAWVKTILTTKSAYGPPLAEETAVAIVEIQNEDSFFFWTFSPQNIPAAKWQALEKQFAQWLIKRYGSLEKTFAAWGAKSKNDAAGRAELFPAWNMTTDGVKNTPGGARRVGDQVRFLAEMQRGFYAETTKFIKQELRYGGLVQASNWHTADPRTLDAIERWTYTATDIIDRHGYFGGKHEGPGSGYSVAVGHTYEDKSALLFPEEMPFQTHGVNGYPQIITELGFTQPNRFRAETTLLSAAYSNLQGTAGLYYFAIGSNFLRDAGIGKFQICDPVIVGAFPAAALMYRRGDVSEVIASYDETIRDADIFAMKGSAAAAAPALDELRAVPNAPASRATFDPLTFYVGRVTRTLEIPPVALKPAFVNRAADHIDRKNKVVRSHVSVHSNRSELTWNYGSGLFTINAPRAQAASGFLAKAGKVDLADVSIESANEYASIIAIALDGQPLASSKKILIQAVTEDKPFGFKSAGGKITDLGSAPFNVKKIVATVALRAGPFKSAKALDENGYPVADVKLTSDAQVTTLELPAASVYTVLER